MGYSREEACLAWLASGLMRADTAAQMLAEEGGAEAIYDRFTATGGQSLSDRISPSSIRLLLDRSDRESMHRMLLVMRSCRMHVLTQEDLRYPDALRNIPQPPAILFYRGELDCLMGRCVTIIGSRSASPQTLIATEQIAEELSRNRVCVISGLAYGIDSAAHRGSLLGGTPGCAVMGCGLDVNYPEGNEELRNELLDAGGLLLSEYPPGMHAAKWTFPVRNRVMSGLASAVVLMEARLRSGSMSTVQHALDQGKEVYAYPGNIGTEWAEASHQLLREGANYFTTARDILEDMGWEEERAPLTKTEKAALPELTPEQRRILGALASGERSFDELAAATSLPTAQLSVGLTILQMAGLVRALPGKIYTKA